MSLKKISKFIVGVFCGAILTISIYSFAVDDNERTIINSPNVEEAKIPVDEINNFAKVYSITKNYYVESVTDTKLIKGAINGMLTNLDPHSTYLDKDEYKQLTEMTSGAFAGLGIEVSRDKDSAGVKVVAPIDGTPAYYAGIKSGDLIIKIDNQPVSSMSLDQAVKKMRGPAGTKVILIVARKNELKPLTFKITRALIEIKSVKYTMLTPDYAYVRITNFQSDTTNSLLKALDNIYNRNNHLKGIVLDLR
nr:PDZ domain-containing protein [Burkholderiales bacterium]